MKVIVWNNGNPLEYSRWRLIPKELVTQDHICWVYDLNDLIPYGKLSITEGLEDIYWNYCSIESFPPEFRAWLLVNNYT